jgi:hypothetical protein
LTVEQRIETVDKLIQELSDNSLSSQFKASEHILKYTSLSAEQLRALTYEECCEAAFALIQHSTYLQLELNKYTAKHNWSKTALDFVITKSVEGYGTQYTPFEQRKRLAILENEYATRLNKYVVDLQLRMDTLSFLPGQLKHMADTLTHLSFGKREYVKPTK